MRMKGTLKRVVSFLEIAFAKAGRRSEGIKGARSVPINADTMLRPSKLFRQF
jgi:hypothetical protein